MQEGQLDSYAQRTADALAERDMSVVSHDVALTIEQVITEDGAVVGHYHLTISDGAALVHSGAPTAADITIRQDAETAQALRDGTLHAQGAFLTGRLSVDGDINKLLEHGPLLAQLLSG